MAHALLRSSLLARSLLALSLAALGGTAEARPRRGDWLPQSPAVHWRSHAQRAVLLRESTSLRRGVFLAPGFELETNGATESATSGTTAPWPNLPKRLLLDQATTLVRLEHARDRVGTTQAGTGRGSVIGIVDSGVDFTHPDLVDADGTPRLSWWLDFGASPYGFHPELERDYGCDGDGLRCAILGPDELRRLAAGEALATPSGAILEPPSDAFGHGTHVASLALGNGATDPRYTGIAPEATLIAARVATEGDLVDDLDVLLATRFVFERADELGQPAVVNLSLGGDMGPHDGSTALERALGAWVKDDPPGRALVVAGGNSGGLSQRSNPELGPFGIHRQARVDGERTLRVPIVLPSVATSNGAFFVWLGLHPRGELEVALEEADGTPVLPFVTRGEAVSATSGRVAATLAHHVASSPNVTDSELGIVLIVSGAFDGNGGFDLLLAGEAGVDLWLQSEGELRARGGALFPNATRERTTTIPATSPHALAVGAVLNRTSWTSFGEPTMLFPFDEQLEFEPGRVLYFSSAGPNTLGHVKPDLVAPGGIVVGAVAAGASALVGGEVNRASLFGPTPLCERPGCAQVDEHHGVTLGSSMAAPLVSGAIALLFEADPSLSQSEVRSLLQAGAARVESDDAHAGAGLLDVGTTFEALALLRDETSAGAPARGPSWLSLAESFVRPGRGPPLRALLHLRDRDDRPSDVALERLELVLSHGRLRSGPARIAPGLYAFDLFAHADAEGRELTIEVHLDGARWLGRSLPIRFESARVPRPADHGCALGRPSPRGGLGALVCSALLLSALGRRRSPSRPR